MRYSTEPATDSVPNRKKRKPSAKLVLLTWVLLIALGVTGAYLYSNHLKESMITQMNLEIQTRTEAMKADYTAQLSDLSAQIEELNSKVEVFNELLTFTKDNSSDKTDNSNKLYSQLNEVKKQLAALQKKMDLLK